MIANRTIVAFGMPATAFVACLFWTFIYRQAQTYLVRNILIRDACGFVIGLAFVAAYIILLATVAILAGRWIAQR